MYPRPPGALARVSGSGLSSAAESIFSAMNRGDVIGFTSKGCARPMEAGHCTKSARLNNSLRASIPSSQLPLE